MPRVVDHAQRRDEIIRNAWRVIAVNGISDLTMRQITARMGMAHGALTPYFSGKDELLFAAFRHIFNRTNARVAAATPHTGIDGLRRMCDEILPLTDELLLEARVVVAFCERCLANPRFAQLYREALSEWEETFVRLLEEAVASGEVRADLPCRTVAVQLNTFLQGAQITAVVDPKWDADEARRRFTEMLDLLA